MRKILVEVAGLEPASSKGSRESFYMLSPSFKFLFSLFEEQKRLKIAFLNLEINPEGKGLSPASKPQLLAPAEATRAKSPA